MKQKAGDTATDLSAVPAQAGAQAGGRGKTAIAPVPGRAYPAPTGKVLFSPKAGISRELSRLIQAAAKEISVAAYAFSSKYLGNALVKAMKRGIFVNRLRKCEVIS